MQSSQIIRIASGQISEAANDDQNLFSGLEELDEIEVPVKDGNVLEPVATSAAGEEKPSIVEAHRKKRVVKISKPVDQGLPQQHGKEAGHQDRQLSQAVTEGNSLPQPEFLKPAPIKAKTKSKSSQAKIAKRRRKTESPTDAAVAIATQSAKIAARQQSETAPAKPVSAKTDTPVRNKASKTTGARRSGNSQSGNSQSGNSQSGNSQPGKSQAGSSHSSKSQSSLSKPRRQKSVTGAATHAAPMPPPAPSKIARSASATALEQPELVTNPLMARGDIVETLIVDLQGADPTKRRKAIWELGQRCDSRAIKPLVNLMTHSDSRQRSLILAALSEIGTQTLKPMKQALAMSLQDDNAEVRKNAIRDLTRIYELVAQISHLLNTALDDPDSEVQDTARWALKQLNRIRTNAGLEGSQAQPILQQSVSPPESFSVEETRGPRSLPN